VGQGGGGGGGGCGGGGSDSDDDDRKPVCLAIRLRSLSPLSVKIQAGAIFSTRLRKIFN